MGVCNLQSCRYQHISFPFLLVDKVSSLKLQPRIPATDAIPGKKGTAAIPAKREIPGNAFLGFVTQHGLGKTMDCYYVNRARPSHFHYKSMDVRPLEHEVFWNTFVIERPLLKLLFTRSLHLVEVDRPTVSTSTLPTAGSSAP